MYRAVHTHAASLLGFQVGAFCFNCASYGERGEQKL